MGTQQAPHAGGRTQQLACRHASQPAPAIPSLPTSYPGPSPRRPRRGQQTPRPPGSPPGRRCTQTPGAWCGCPAFRCGGQRGSTLLQKRACTRARCTAGRHPQAPASAAAALQNTAARLRRPKCSIYLPTKAGLLFHPPTHRVHDVSVHPRPVVPRLVLPIERQRGLVNSVQAPPAEPMSCRVTEDRCQPTVAASSAQQCAGAGAARMVDLTPTCPAPHSSQQRAAHSHPRSTAACRAHLPESRLASLTAPAMLSVSTLPLACFLLALPLLLPPPPLLMML